MNRAFIVVFLVITASLFACGKKIAFKAFSSGDGRFEVMTPIALEQKSQLYSFENGQVTMHSFAGSVDDVVYVVNYFDIPDQINTELTKQRPGYAIPGRAVMVESNGWKVDAISGDEIRVSGACEKFCIAGGEHFTATTSKQIIYVRLLWFGNRIYQIMAAHPAKPSYNQEAYAKKFVWSFKISQDK